MAETGTVRDTPEFHIIVRRGRGTSPLAPYRFAITFLFAMAVSGMSIWHAAQSGHAIDDALIRVGGSALFAWLVLGRIDAILRSAGPPPSAHAERRTDPT